MDDEKQRGAEAARNTIEFIVDVLGKTNDLELVLDKFDQLLSDYIRLEVEDGYFECAFCLMEKEGKVSRNDFFKVLFLLKEADADESYHAMLFNYENIRERVVENSSLLPA